VALHYIDITDDWKYKTRVTSSRLQQRQESDEVVMLSCKHGRRQHLRHETAMLL
jgi:hypothetical protein